jgi:hypothetical protein
MLGSSWVAAQLAASQEGLSSMSELRVGPERNFGTAVSNGPADDRWVLSVGSMTAREMPICLEKNLSTIIVPTPNPTTTLGLRLLTFCKKQINRSDILSGHCWPVDHAMRNTAIRDTGRKPYKLRHVLPEANLGNTVGVRPASRSTEEVAPTDWLPCYTLPSSLATPHQSEGPYYSYLIMALTLWNGMWNERKPAVVRTFRQAEDYRVSLHVKLPPVNVK